MKKILIFPLLRMPSGHHKVADTIANYLETNASEPIICKKIDLLSSWNPTVEKVVTSTYLRWIHIFPKSYAWVYKRMAYSTDTKRSYKKYYEHLFLNKMKEIIAEENPDLIVCTHGFPSYLLSRLKMRNECQIPIINVYTDFFINDIWGRTGIEYHFVPNESIKEKMLQEAEMNPQHIYVTGIPINKQFYEVKRRQKPNKAGLNILLSGGSAGVGDIEKILEQTVDEQVKYTILCGKNEHLYMKLQRMNKVNIRPLPYISSAEKMDEIYDGVDAVITKPGGATVSESLAKKLPIFIHSVLPGQEEINLKVLQENKLVHVLNQNISIEQQLMSYFENNDVMCEYHQAREHYLQNLKFGNPSAISYLLQSLLQKVSVRRRVENHTS